MADKLSIKIIQSSQGFANLVFSGRPTDAMLEEMKAEGWRYSRNNNCWYPSKNAQGKDQMFAYRFVAKYDPQEAQRISDEQTKQYAQEISNSLVSDHRTDEQKQTDNTISAEEFNLAVEEEINKIEAEESLNSLSPNQKKIFELFTENNISVDRNKLLEILNQIDATYQNNSLQVDELQDYGNFTDIDKEEIDNETLFELDNDESRMAEQIQDQIESREMNRIINEQEIRELEHRLDDIANEIEHSDVTMAVSIENGLKRVEVYDENMNPLFKIQESNNTNTPVFHEYYRDYRDIEPYLEQQDLAQKYFDIIHSNDVSTSYLNYTFSKSNNEAIENEKNNAEFEELTPQKFAELFNEETKDSNSVLKMDEQAAKAILDSCAKDFGLYLHHDVMIGTSNESFLDFKDVSPVEILRASIIGREEKSPTNIDPKVGLIWDTVSMTGGFRAKERIVSQYLENMLAYYNNGAETEEEISFVNKVLNTSRWTDLDTGNKMRIAETLLEYNKVHHDDHFKRNTFSAEEELRTPHFYFDETLINEVFEAHREAIKRNEERDIYFTEEETEILTELGFERWYPNEYIKNLGGDLNPLHITVTATTYDSDKRGYNLYQLQENIPYDGKDYPSLRSALLSIVEDSPEYKDLLGRQKLNQTYLYPKDIMPYLDDRDINFYKNYKNPSEWIVAMNKAITEYEAEKIKKSARFATEKDLEEHNLHKTELSVEELQKILQPDGFTADAATFMKDYEIRRQENPLESEKESKIMVAWEYLYDKVDWDVITETEEELDGDAERHSELMEVRASILDKLCENIVENKYENLNDIMANFRIIRDAEIANISKEYMEQYELYENTNKAILKFERLYDYIEEHGSEELLGKLNKVEEVLNEIENSVNKNTIIEKINNFSFGDENFSPENLEIDFSNAEWEETISSWETDIEEWYSLVVHNNDIEQINNNEPSESLEHSSNEPNLSEEPNTYLLESYDSVTTRYNEQYKNFYETFAKLRAQQLENEARYVSDARIRNTYEQAFDELVKLTKEELADIIAESQSEQEAITSAVRFINEIPLTQERVLASTFKSPQYTNPTELKYLAHYDNGKFIAPSANDLRSYIQAEYRSVKIDGLSIFEKVLITKEISESPSKIQSEKMLELINQYENAIKDNDAKSKAKVIYYLSEYNYLDDIVLLKNEKIEDLRKQYSQMEYGVISLVGEFDEEHVDLFKTPQEAIDEMLKRNKQAEIDGTEKSGISLKYNDGRYSNSEYIPFYIPGDGIQNDILEVDSHFRTNAAKKNINKLIDALNQSIKINKFDIPVEFDIDEQCKEFDRREKRIELRSEYTFKGGIPKVLEGKEFNSWIKVVTSPQTTSYFLFYESEGKLKSQYLNEKQYEDVKDWLKNVEENDLLRPSARKIYIEQKQFSAVLNAPVETLEKAVSNDKIEEYTEKLVEEAEQEQTSDVETSFVDPVENVSSKENEPITLTEVDLANAESVIPNEQYRFVLESMQSEEREYFASILKKSSETISAAQKKRGENINKDGSHPCIFHYWIGNSDWYISEIDKDGIGFGYAILRDDLQNSEWGYVNICGDGEDALTRMKVNAPVMINGQTFTYPVGVEMDFHLEEGTTIERELYKRNSDYFSKYKEYAEEQKKEKSIDELKADIINDCLENEGKDSAYIFAQVKEKGTLENLHLETLVIDAIKTGEPKTVSNLFTNLSKAEIQLYPLLSSVDEDGNNALHIAAKTLRNTPITAEGFEEATMYETVIEEMQKFININISDKNKAYEVFDKARLRLERLNKTNMYPLEIAKASNTELIAKNYQEELANLSEVSINNIEETKQNITEENYGSEITDELEGQIGNTLRSNSDREVEPGWDNRESDSRTGQRLQQRESEADVSLDNSRTVPGINQERLESQSNSIPVERGLSDNSENTHSEVSSGIGSSDMSERGMDSRPLSPSSSTEQPGNELTEENIKNLQNNAERIDNLWKEYKRYIVKNFSSYEKEQFNELFKDYPSSGLEPLERKVKQFFERNLRGGTHYPTLGNLNEGLHTYTADISSSKETHFELFIKDENGNEIKDTKYLVHLTQSIIIERNRGEYIDLGIPSSYINQREELIKNLLSSSYEVEKKWGQILQLDNNEYLKEFRTDFIADVTELIKANNEIVIKNINAFDLSSSPDVSNGRDRRLNDLHYNNLVTGEFREDTLETEVENLHKERKINELKLKYGNEPFVMNVDSESRIFKQNNYTLREFNEMVESENLRIQNDRKYLHEKYNLTRENDHRLFDMELSEEDVKIRQNCLGYDKTDFTIVWDKGESSYTPVRMDIGDGDGNVFDFVRSTCSYDEVINELNKVEDSLYYNQIDEDFALKVKEIFESHKEELSNQLSEKAEQLKEVRNELKGKWLIEVSEAENNNTRKENLLNDIENTVTDNLKQIYNEIYGYETPSINNEINNSFVIKESRKYLTDIFNQPSREMQRAMNEHKGTSFDWDTWREWRFRMPVISLIDSEFTSKILEESLSNMQSYSNHEQTVAMDQPSVEPSQTDKKIKKSKAPQDLKKSDIKEIRKQCEEILKKSDSEITEEDKEILSQYEGAGGLHEGGQTAEAVLSEFYTPTNVIEKVWNLVDYYAPNAKTVLEPTAGTGRFAVNRPNNQFTLHELDETSARIAKILHPEAEVKQGAYQKQFFDEGGRIYIGEQKEHYDVVIGNPPYGDYRSEWKGRGEGQEYDTYQEYFLSKGLDALKDKDSILAMVVPSSILKNKNDKVKKIIADKGQLIDAFRLPEGAFPTTEVGTDILIFRNWETERENIKNHFENMPNSTDADIDDKLEVLKLNMADEISNDIFFTNHPEKVLGTVEERTNRYGKAEKYVKNHPYLTIEGELEKIDYAISTYKLLPVIQEQIKDFNDTDKREIMWLFETRRCHDERLVSLYQEVIGKFGYSEGRERTKFLEFALDKHSRHNDYYPWFEVEDLYKIGLLDESITYHTLWDRSEILRHAAIDKTPISKEEYYNKLNLQIENVINTEEPKAENIQPSSVGSEISEPTEELDDASKRIYDDPNGLFATKHQLTKKEFAEFYTGTNFNDNDYNIWAATDFRGNVDLSKLSEKEIAYLKSSNDYIETSKDVYTNTMLYATGNIYEKLDTLEDNKESLSVENYERAKSLLEAAVPTIVPMNEIMMDALSPLAEEFKVTREITSSRWYMGTYEVKTSTESVSLKEDFLNWCTNCSSPENFEGEYGINGQSYINNFSIARISREDISEDISWADIYKYCERVPVQSHVDKDDSKETKLKKETIAGQKKDLRKSTAYTLFNRYLQEGLPQEDKDRLQDTWNRIYNSQKQADYQKLPLFIEGMSTFKGNSPFMLFKQQVEGVNRLLSKGNGLLAYEVGVGKTACGIVATVGQMQAGRCKKPLIVVPNQVYKKWLNDFRGLFPDVKINDLYNLSDKYLESFYDEKTHSLIIEPGTVSIITDSALQKITFSDKVCEEELNEEFGYLLGLTEDLESEDDKIRAEAEQKIKLAIGQASRITTKKHSDGREQKIQQQYIFFDECGFDNLCVDEAHNYKNLFTVPRPKRRGGEKIANEFEGIGQGKPSRRAQKIFAMTTLIQKHNEDRNVFLLTATPFTNNPLEVYSMLSYMGRKELLERHIYDVRDFCTEFALTKYEYSVTPSGDVKPKAVMKNFRGQRKLKNLVHSYIDQVSAEEAGIARPECEKHPVFLQLSPLQEAIIKIEQDTIVSEGNPYVVLKAMTTMRTATLSPALIDADEFAGSEIIEELGGIPSKDKLVESSPKLTWVCNTVTDLYKQKPECGQFIYMPQGTEYFDEVKNYLIKQGIPEDAIDYIHGEHNNKPEQKDKISAKFNDKNDKLKILIGSKTVAEGIDLNGNSFIEYNTMLGWNPTESIQVEGRIWRQGNEQGKVHIMYPLMENSIDALMYQKHDEKTQRINSVLSKEIDGKDVIETNEINPEELKFELITDPEKKINLIIEQKTVDKKKELKLVENRIEELNELEGERQKLQEIQNNNTAEKEKQKTLLKIAREELKLAPENWQKQTNVSMKERAIDTCNKEISKCKNRISSIMYNLNKMGIQNPEVEVPIKNQELIVRKAEIEADIQKIIDSKAELLVEEQKKLLEKKILSKPVEVQRKEYVQLVLRDTWYKKQNDDRTKKPSKPVEAVKDFVLPKEMIEKFDKAISDKDYFVLRNYINWGDRDILNQADNEKAVELLRKRYEEKTNEKLPERYDEVEFYLSTVCEKNVPSQFKCKTKEELIAIVCKNWHGEAYDVTKEGDTEKKINYITIDNYKKNRSISELAKGLIKNEGQGWLGHGGEGLSYQCNPKKVHIKGYVDGQKVEFDSTWHEIATVKAAQLDKEYPREKPQRVESEIETPTDYSKDEDVIQFDLFDFEQDFKQPVKEINIINEPRNLYHILNNTSFDKYRGLPPFVKVNEDTYKVRCKGADLEQVVANPMESYDIIVNEKQMRKSVVIYLKKEHDKYLHDKYENPNTKCNIITPKPVLTQLHKELYRDNGISNEEEMQKDLTKNFRHLFVDNEKPIIKQPTQTKVIENNNALTLPSKDVKVIETEFKIEDINDNNIGDWDFM